MQHGRRKSNMQYCMWMTVVSADLKDVQIQHKLLVALQAAFLDLLGNHHLCQLEEFACW